MATAVSKAHSGSKRRPSGAGTNSNPILLDSMGAYRSLTRMELEPAITHTGPPPTGTPPISSHATKPFINDDILAERSTSEEIFIPSPRSGGVASPRAHAQITLTDLTPSSKPLDNNGKSTSSLSHQRVLRLKPPRYAGLVPLPIKPFSARTAKTAQKEIIHKKWWYQTYGGSPSIDGAVERIYVIPNTVSNTEDALFEEVRCDQGLPASSKARRAMQSAAEPTGPMSVVKPTFCSLFGPECVPSTHKIAEQKARWIRLFPKLAHDEGKFKLKRLLFGDGNKPLYPKDSDAPDTFLGAFDCWTIHNGGRQWVSIFVTTNHICISTASGDVRDEVHFSNILSIRHCAVLENEENTLGEELLTTITLSPSKSSNSPKPAKHTPSFHSRKVSIGAAPHATLSVRDFELSVAAMNLRQGDHSIMRRPQYDDIPTFVPIDEERKIPTATTEEGGTLIPPSMAPSPKASKQNTLPKHFDPLSMYSPLIKPNSDRPAAGEWLAHATESPLKNKRMADSQHSRIPSSPPVAIESPEPVMTSTTLRGVTDGEADDFQVQANETSVNSEHARGTHPIPFEERPSYAANLKLQALLLSIMKSPDSDSSHRTSPITASNTPSPSKHSSQSPSLPSNRAPAPVPAPPPPPPPATAVQIFTRTGTVYHFWGLLDLTTTPVGAKTVSVEPKLSTTVSRVVPAAPAVKNESGGVCPMCKALGFSSLGNGGATTNESSEPVQYRTPLSSDLNVPNIISGFTLDGNTKINNNTTRKDAVSLTCPRCGNVGTSIKPIPKCQLDKGFGDLELPPSPTLLHIRHRHQQFETFDRLVDTTWRMCIARINGVEVHAVSSTSNNDKKQQKGAKGPTPTGLMALACSPQLLFVSVLKSKIEYETPDGNIFTLESAKQGASKNNSVSSRSAMGGSLGGSLSAVDRLLNRSGGVDGGTYKSASQTNRSALLSKMSFDNQNNQSKLQNRSLGTSMLMSSSTARGSYNNRKINTDLQNGVVVKPRGNNKSISASSSAGTAPYSRQSITETPLTA